MCYLLEHNIPIVQWGTFTNRTCVFPIQFTESCFCALHQPINLSNDHLSATNWAVYNLNTKGFSHGDLSSNHFFMVIGKYNGDMILIQIMI